MQSLSKTGQEGTRGSWGTTHKDFHVALKGSKANAPTSYEGSCWHVGVGLSYCSQMLQGDLERDAYCSQNHNVGTRIAINFGIPHVKEADGCVEMGLSA